MAMKEGDDFKIVKPENGFKDLTGENINLTFTVFMVSFMPVLVC